MNAIATAPQHLVVRPSDAHISNQGSHYAPGVSSETTGATSLFLGLITLAPGQRTLAHVHEHHESAHYMLSGEEVELWTGLGLQRRDLVRPGEFLFIPAGLPHVAVNRSHLPAVFVGARNDANLQESASLLPELDTLVP